jgi:uncharacterized membrane protein SpoIIM required for sporulation/ABC-type transport system involved in multi-copper enzyme maturation permease subunit
MTIHQGLAGRFAGAWIVARREVSDQMRDWRILTPILLLTLFFPLLMNFTARQAMSFVERYGAPIVGDRLIPFLLMVVGFFPISISLVIALEAFAGERERLTLEPLLATPIPDFQLYLGKMLASLLLPLVAAYLGIGVYLFGLFTRLGWRPPGTLLAQVLILTAVQALLMVSGAVVISSQATSVRSANLLASFIILPVSQLIIGESVIMFWGRYDELWWVVVGEILVVLVLMRMGAKLFNREAMLGREIDALNWRWAWSVFRREFIGAARSVGQWYGGIWRDTLKELRPALALTALALIAGYLIGQSYAQRFLLPKDMVDLTRLQKGAFEELAALGFMNLRGWTWIFWHNLRALLLGTLLAIFSFGVASQLVLMLPMVIVGFIAGNLTTLGMDAGRIMGALILPHGVLEIPAAVLAGGAMLKLGMAVISPPQGMTLGEGWLRALAQWARVGLGLVIPLLMAAAYVEAFVTPRIALTVLAGY